MVVRFIFIEKAMTAKDILLKAVKCDQTGRILEAEFLYQEGIQILKDIVREEDDFEKKKVFCDRIQEYVDRATQIKERVQRYTSQGEIISHITIAENDTGYSYNKLFGKYITADAKEVILEEPYVMERYHFKNLISFLELLVRKNSRIKFICLITKADPKNPCNQLEVLKGIKEDLNSRRVEFIFKFENSLHDRKIFLSNGFIIKIGRGLHIYKHPNPLFSLGYTDYDFRKCLQTDVDVWRTKYTC